MRSKREWLYLAVALIVPVSVISCMQPDGFDVSLSASDQAFKDKQYKTAENGYLRAIDFAEKDTQTGKNDENVIRGLKALGSCYAAQGKFTEAEPVYRRATQLLESRVGTDITTTGKLSPHFDEWVQTLMSLADTYRAEARYKDAEAVYKRVLDLENKLTTPDLISKSEAQSELGETYSKQKKFKDAEVLFKSALDSLAKAPSTPRKQFVLIDTMEDYAQTLAQMNRMGEATKLHEQAKALRSKESGGT